MVSYGGQGDYRAKLHLSIRLYTSVKCKQISNHFIEIKFFAKTQLQSFVHQEKNKIIYYLILLPLVLPMFSF